MARGEGSATREGGAGSAPEEEDTHATWSLRHRSHELVTVKAQEQGVRVSDLGVCDGAAAAGTRLRQGTRGGTEGVEDCERLPVQCCLLPRHTHGWEQDSHHISPVLGPGAAMSTLHRPSGAPVIEQRRLGETPGTNSEFVHDGEG